MPRTDTHDPRHRLQVWREERQVEIAARYRRDCELAKQRAETDLADLAEWWRHTARLVTSQQAA